MSGLPLLPRAQETGWTGDGLQELFVEGVNDCVHFLLALALELALQIQMQLTSCFPSQKVAGDFRSFSVAGLSAYPLGRRIPTEAQRLYIYQPHFRPQEPVLDEPQSLAIHFTV